MEEASSLDTLTPELQRYCELDNKLVEAARQIRVLSALGWSVGHYDAFIQGWLAGRPQLPAVEYPRFDLSQARQALQAIVRQCDPHHPIGRYLLQTARSYMVAARMLENVGTKQFRALSEALYGRPKDKLGKLSNLRLADDFIKITSDFAAATDPEGEICIRPEAVAEELKERAARFFTHHRIDVVVDESLAAKAAAGSERVRIRGRTGFSRAEIEQLLEHELLVHSATMLNGRGQPYLKSLGMGAPRTTGTQEGLATFAEVITDTMDLARLRRIALRIKAIDLACEGGDFIDVFRFFIEAGQSHKESFQSSARIFRGGDVRGRWVFTKDVVYLKGLVSVHTFMRKAIEVRKIDYPRWLFLGRLALGDVVLLEDFIRQGFIGPPLYLPPWAASRERLAAYLSYSVFSSHLKLKHVTLSDFVDELDESHAGVDPLNGVA